MEMMGLVRLDTEAVNSMGAVGNLFFIAPNYLLTLTTKLK